MTRTVRSLTRTVRSRFVLALALAGLSSLGLASPVAAHAQLVSSTPGAGEVLAAAPAQVRLVFSEPADPAYAGLDLLDESGMALATAIGRPDPTDPQVLIADLPQLDEGLYTVNWHVLSAADGHVTQGFITFGVGNVEAPGTGSDAGIGRLHLGQSPIVAVLDAASRLAAYGGAMLGFGLPLIGLTVLGPALGRIPRRIVVIAAAALGLAAVGSAALILVGSSGLAASADTSALEYALGTRSGQLLAARTVLAALGGALVVLFAGSRPRLAMVGGGVAAACCLALIAVGGHAAASGAVGPVVADLAHVAAAGTWLAGLLGLVLLIAGLLGHTAVDATRAAVPRFSALALVSIGFVAATGLYAGWLQVGDLAALGTEYGLLLAAKVAVVAAALTLGGINYIDAGRGLAIAGGLRRRVTAELTLATLVLVITANLTSGSPPAQVQTVDVPPVGGSSAFQLAFQPGGPGPNRVLVSAPPPGIHLGTVELQLGRLDGGGSTRVELRMDPTAPHGTRFVADGILLPAGSRWDASAVVLDADGIEMVRQRFSFGMGPDGLEVDRTFSLDLGILVGGGLLLGALVGLGYWLGGGSLPRTAPGIGRVALLIGGMAGAALGAVMLLWGPGG